MLPAPLFAEIVLETSLMNIVDQDQTAPYKLALINKIFADGFSRQPFQMHFCGHLKG